MHIFRRIFLSNYWWQESDILSQASYRYAILWEAFLDPSDSYFLFADLVDFYSHWTYMHIFRHIFLSNYWWQRSDIWSQASYRYLISWEAILDPSDSYFLFADFVDFSTHWTYMLIFRRIFLSNYWWQKSDIWSQASYRYPISWEAFFDPSDSYFLFAKEQGQGYHRWALAHSSSCCFYSIIEYICTLRRTRVHEIRQSCQTWPVKYGQILLRTDTRLVILQPKINEDWHFFFTRTTKHICSFFNPALLYAEIIQISIFMQLMNY